MILWIRKILSRGALTHVKTLSWLRPAGQNLPVILILCFQIGVYSRDWLVIWVLNSFFRPMDIRFSVSTDHIILRQHWPRGLETYYNNLKSLCALFFMSLWHWFMFDNSLTTSDQAIAQPDIPLTLTKDGIDYQLSLSSTVRQTLDPDLSVSLLSEPSLRLVVESVLELESHERSRLCQVGPYQCLIVTFVTNALQVTCDDITSDVSWEAFLKNCNILVASPSSTQTPPSWNFSWGSNI